jgi:hypothetical protein
LEVDESHDWEKVPDMKGSGCWVEACVCMDRPRPESLLSTFGEITEKSATAKFLKEGRGGHRRRHAWRGKLSGE